MAVSDTIRETDELVVRDHERRTEQDEIAVHTVGVAGTRVDEDALVPRGADHGLGDRR